MVSMKLNLEISKVFSRKTLSESCRLFIEWLVPNYATDIIWLQWDLTEWHSIYLKI